MPRLLPGTSPETDLYALTDDELSLGRPAVEVAKALLDSGIKILQYREKEKNAGQMLKECLELRRLTREAGACFIVNDHVDIAVLCEADGVHVGQEDLPVEAVRRLVGPDMIIGLSTHTPDQARAAVASGADYIKTSTGFGGGGATREDVALFAKHVGPNVKIKAAGGIANLQDAEDFIKLGASRLGTSRVVKAVKAMEQE